MEDSSAMAADSPREPTTSNTQRNAHATLRRMKRPRVFQNLLQRNPIFGVFLEHGSYKPFASLRTFPPFFRGKIGFFIPR